MHLPESDRDLDGGLQELVERQRPVPEELADGHAAEVLEDHQKRLLVAAKLVAADDAWEVQAVDDLELAAVAGQFRGGRIVVLEDLDYDREPVVVPDRPKNERVLALVEPLSDLESLNERHVIFAWLYDPTASRREPAVATEHRSSRSRDRPGRS